MNAVTHIVIHTVYIMKNSIIVKLLSYVIYKRFILLLIICSSLFSKPTNCSHIT